MKKSDIPLLLVTDTSPRIPPPLQGGSTTLEVSEAFGFRGEVARLRFGDADVAQLVEQLTCNQPVGGSTPLVSSISILFHRLLKKFS